MSLIEAPRCGECHERDRRYGDWMCRDCREAYDAARASEGVNGLTYEEAYERISKWLSPTSVLYFEDHKQRWPHGYAAEHILVDLQRKIDCYGPVSEKTERKLKEVADSIRLHMRRER